MKRRGKIVSTHFWYMEIIHVRITPNIFNTNLNYDNYMYMYNMNVIIFPRNVSFRGFMFSSAT